MVSKLENGTFSKCCRMNVQAPHDKSMSLSTGLTADNVEKIINGAISKAVKTLNVKFSTVTGPINAISGKIDSISLNLDDAVYRISSTVKRVVDLKDKMDIMEGTVADMVNHSFQKIYINSLSKACLDEINDRINRRKNLIWFC